MTESSSAGSPHEASEPRYGKRLDPQGTKTSSNTERPDLSDFQPLSFEEVELPSPLSEPVVTKKRKWAKIGIIATAIYAVYGLILMLLIEPLSASPVGLRETYSRANATEHSIGVFEAIMFAIVGVALAVGIRQLVVDRDKILPRHVQMIYLSLLALGAPALFISSLGTTMALSAAFGTFGVASGLWYVLPYAISVIAGIAALGVFIAAQARQDDED
jgi:hypothetical protein